MRRPQGGGVRGLNVVGKGKRLGVPFGPDGGPLGAVRSAVVYWAPSLFYLCPAGG